MSDAVTVPDAIPERVQAAYRQEARRRVLGNPPAATQPVAGPPPGGLVPAPASMDAPGPADHAHRPALGIAAMVAMPGALALTVLWSWLAVTTRDPIWWWFVAAGAALVVTAAAGVSRALTRDRAPTAAPPGPTARWCRATTGRRR